jgi:hypothetical protein
VWWFGDGDGPEALEGSTGFRRFDFPLRNPVNAGITGLQIRPVPLTESRYEVFVQLAAHGSPGPELPVDWEVTVAGHPLQFRSLELAPGAAASFVIPVEGAEGQRLEVKVKLAGDALAWDDLAAVELPPPQPLIVAWWPGREPDPFLELALRSLSEQGRVEVIRGAPDQWPPVDLADVNVFDGWLPSAWEQRVPAIVVNPPESPVLPLPYVALRGGGLPRDSVRSVADDHPVLFRVATPRVSLCQTGVLDGTGAWQPLWLAGDQTVMVAGEREDQRVVVMAFSPQRSAGLPLEGAFPVLVGNALFWCGERRLASSPEELVQRTGTLREWKTGPVAWRTRLEDGSWIEETADPKAGFAPLDRAGLWKYGPGPGESGASLLLSPTEGDLPAAAQATGEAPSPTSWLSWLGGDAVPMLLAAVLFLLLLESWLYHRRGVT